MVDVLVKSVEISGYNVVNVQSNIFKAEDKNVSILFDLAGKNGKLTLKVIRVLDKNKNRTYSAYRYIKKYFPELQNIGDYLARNNYVWDYGQNVPFLETYKKEIESDYKKCDNYFKRCIEKGMDTLTVDGEKIYTYPTFEQYFNNRSQYIMPCMSANY